MSASYPDQLIHLKQLHSNMRESEQIPPESLDALDEADIIIENLLKDYVNPDQQSDYLDLLSNLTQQNNELLNLVLDDPATKPRAVALTIPRNSENTKENHRNTSVLDIELSKLQQELTGSRPDSALRDLLSKEDARNLETRSFQISPDREGAISPISMAESLKTMSDPIELHKRLIEMEAKYVLLQSPFGRKSDRYTIYRNKLREQNKELKKLLDINAELAQKNIVFKEENERLLRQVGMVAALKEKLKKLNAFHTAREQQMNAMKDDVSKSDGKVKVALREARQEKLQLLKTIAELKAQVATLLENQNNLAQGADAALAAQLAALNVQLNTLNAQNTALTGQNTAMEEKLLKTTQEKGELHRQLNEMQKKYEEACVGLKEKEGELRRKTEELAGQTKGLCDEVSAKDLTIAGKDKELSELKTLNGQLTEKVREYESLIVGNAKSIERLGSDKETLNETINSLTRQNIELKDAVETHLQTIKTLEDKLEDKTLKLTEENKKTEQLNATIAALQQSQAENEQQKQKVDSEFSELKETHVNLAKDLTETKESLATSTEEAVQLQSQLTLSEATVVAKEVLLQEAIKDKVNLEKTILELETKLSVATVELKALRKKYDVEVTKMGESLKNYENTTTEQGKEIKTLKLEVSTVKSKLKSPSKSPAKTKEPTEAGDAPPETKSKPKEEKKKSTKKSKEETTEEPEPAKKSSRKTKTEAVPETPEEGKKSKKSKEKPAEEEKKTKKSKDTGEDAKKGKKSDGEEKKTKKSKDAGEEKKPSKKLKEVAEEPSPDEKASKKKSSKTEESKSAKKSKTPKKETE